MNSAIRTVAFAASTGSMSSETPYSSLDGKLHHRNHVPRRRLRRYRCCGPLAPSPRGLWDKGLLQHHHWRRLHRRRRRGALNPSPRVLGGEDLSLCLTGGALRCIPASLFSSSSRLSGILRAWLSGILRAASAGIISSSQLGGIFFAASAGVFSGIRPDSALLAASAGLSLGARPSSLPYAALADVIRVRLRPDRRGS